MYDPVVFYTDNEYQQQNPGVDVCIQSEVELPAGSSSGEDQSALIGDRINCLFDLSTPIKTDDGIDITDTLRFFTGDHPAAQFEQGSKQGGTYKCGACGCNEVAITSKLQSLATGGQFGKQAGILRPFDNLKVKELRTELGARGVCVDQSMLKNDIQKTLDNILRGVMRVPALLLPHPTQCLSSLNLERYEVVASEPLHDIKGHINLITELQHILTSGDTAMLLRDLECSSKVLLLSSKLVKFIAVV